MIVDKLGFAAAIFPSAGGVSAPAFGADGVVYGKEAQRASENCPFADNPHISTIFLQKNKVNLIIKRLTLKFRIPVFQI